MLSFKDIYKFALDFIFTKRCRYCHKPCNITEDVCDACAEDISAIDGEICYKCGCSKIICSCKGKAHFYESVCAPYYYEGAPRKAVISLKHKKISETAEALGSDMAQCVSKRYEHIYFDYCTFVPMFCEDEKKRGYNQARTLAQILGEKLSIPCEELITKDFKTASQHTLPESLRSGNLSGVFGFNNESGIDITDMRILLCDDIKTTGTTLDECAKALLFAGAAEVRCVCACIAIKNKEKPNNGLPLYETLT